MAIYCHGSLYFQTDVSLFISFSFLHLDCVSQRTCPNLLMASKAIDFTHAGCLVGGRSDGSETTVACHSLRVLLLISSDLTALPSEARGRRMEKGKKAAATF